MKALLYIYLPLIYASLVGLFCLVMYAVREQVSFRRLCFGWICRLRKQHVGRLKSVWRYELTGGVVANYRCCCGLMQSHWVDVQRGGRVLRNWTWR
jgi:hypothetical protein